MIRLVGQALDTYSVVSNEKFDSQIGLKKLDIIRRKVLRKFGLDFSAMGLPQSFMLVWLHD